MAPNPNECITLQKQPQQQSQQIDSVITPQLQVIKIVTTLSDDGSSEDGEHFYDASSDVGSHSELAGYYQQHRGSIDGGRSGKQIDSGVDVEKESSDDNDFDLPEQELAQQIVEQVEYYFSDEHILKDAFLLKHARRNRDGFISLKLITSFKKVKHVTKDWRVVAYACRALSKRLEVNEAGTKVRRVAPLPDTDETSPSRTVVAIGLSPERATIESVAEMLGSNGSIALIRILRPGNTIPPDVRQCANRHPDILTSVCAVVEFELADSARQALANASSLALPVRLVELASRRGNSNRTSPTTSRPVTPQPGQQQQQGSAANTPNPRRKRRPVQLPQQQQKQQGALDNELAPKSPYLRRAELVLGTGSNSSTPMQSPQLRRHMNININGNRPGVQSPVRPKSASCSESQQNSPPQSMSPPGSHSPWVRRRLGLDSGRSSPMPSADNRLSVPPNIVRMPNGPDGTRGFHLNKPRSASAPEVPLMLTICAM